MYIYKSPRKYWDSQGFSKILRDSWVFPWRFLLWRWRHNSWHAVGPPSVEEISVFHHFYFLFFLILFRDNYAFLIGKKKILYKKNFFFFYFPHFSFFPRCIRDERLCSHTCACVTFFLTKLNQRKERLTHTHIPLLGFLIFFCGGGKHRCTRHTRTWLCVPSIYSSRTTFFSFSLTPSLHSPPPLFFVHTNGRRRRRKKKNGRANAHSQTIRRLTSAPPPRPPGF